MPEGLYIQVGCGYCAPPGWVSFDSSPSLRIERLPLVGRFLRVNETRFPDLARVGNVIRGLPVADGAAVAVYASHVLEHLARDEVDAALRECHRVLRVGGVLRLVVPDLRSRAEAYARAAARADAGAADMFMRETTLGRERRPKGLVPRLRHHFGGSAHLWMWDYPALEAAVRRAGFRDARCAAFGDSGDPMFDRVEDEGRFFWRERSTGNARHPECALQAVK